MSDPMVFAHNVSSRHTTGCKMPAVSLRDESPDSIFSQASGIAGDVYSGHVDPRGFWPLSGQGVAESLAAAWWRGSFVEAWHQHERPDSVCSHCVVISIVLRGTR